jgi:hypothetical protein
MINLLLALDNSELGFGGMIAFLPSILFLNWLGVNWSFKKKLE